MPELAGTDLPEAFANDRLEYFPLSLVLTDPHRPDNPIVYVNRAFTQMTGYDSSAVIGRNCRFLQGDQSDHETRERLRQAVREEREETVDILNYRANGEPFVNRLMIAPIKDDHDAETTFFLGVQSRFDGRDGDATQAMRLAERLRELQHRVKNHISMVLSMVRVAAKETESAGDVVKILGPRVEALSLLYDQLCQDPGRMDQDEVALGAYLSRVCSAVAGLSDNVAVRVNVDICEATAPGDDSARIGLILCEVLTNALQHAFGEEDRGAIEISLRPEATGMVLRVADNGRGFEEEEWPNKSSLGGRIVLDLVKRLNAELEVSSGSAGTMVALHLSDRVKGSDA